LAVPVVGRRDDHRVDIALVEQLAIVEITLDLEPLRDLIDALLVDVAGRDDLAGVILLAECREGAGIVAAAPAAADHADVDTVIGADDAAGGLARGFGEGVG